MIKYTAKDMKGVLRKELREYEVTIGYMTPDELKELREWVAAGNSVHCNPHILYGDDGHPMDYITANRIAEDMNRNPDNYHTEPKSCADDEIEELPF